MFPTPPFNATVWPAGAQPLASNAEIVRVTAISTDTLTIVRTQEGTSARTIVVGDQINAPVSNKTLTDIETDLATADSNIATNTTAIAAAALASRLISTTAPLTGGGDLSANRTLGASVFVASGGSHASGIVPDPGPSAGSTKFLREDASFNVPVVLGAATFVGENQLISDISGNNVASIKNVNQSGFSAIRFLKYNGDEKGAIGYGNPSAGITTDQVFLEVSDAAHSGTAPAFVFNQSTDFGQPGTTPYGVVTRLKFDTDGTFTLYDRADGQHLLDIHPDRPGVATFFGNFTLDDSKPGDNVQLLAVNESSTGYGLLSSQNNAGKNSLFQMWGSAVGGTFGGLSGNNLARWTTNAANLLIGTTAVSPVVFCVNTVEAGRFNTSGNFSVVGTLSAGSGPTTLTDSVGKILSASLNTVAVGQGGTGDTTLTAYAPLFGGTTATAPVQSGTVGTSGQVLTSNGAGALPTFQAAAGGGSVAPLSTIAAGTGAGTSPTVSVVGTDQAGQITVTTGTAPTGTNAIVATITFNLAFGTSPYVVLYPANALTATLSGISMVFVTSTTTTFVITSGTTALTGSSTYLWNFIVIG